MQKAARAEKPVTLAELAQRLLAVAEPSLLDTPLDRLTTRAAVDAEAGELFAQIFEAGEADCLRQLCEDGRLDAWAEHTATEREADAMRAQLRRWVGHEGAGPGGDDPARLVAVPELPSSLEDILKWARPFDLLGELSRPAREVLPHEPALSPEVSLLACCLGVTDAAGGAAPRGRSALIAGRAQERARAYLIAQAGKSGALAARSALWKKRPEAPLARLVERLRALLGSTDLTLLNEVRFVPAWPVRIDDPTAAAEGHLISGDERGAFATKIFLSGYESRALMTSCECERPACLHVRALAGRLLDASLDEHDRLHDALARFTAEPSWQRFVRALAVKEKEPGARRGDQGPQATAVWLSFGLRLPSLRRRAHAAEHSGVQLGVFVHEPPSAKRAPRAPGARGTPGALGARDASSKPEVRLANPRALLRGAKLGASDPRLLERMAELGRTKKPAFVPVDRALLRALSERSDVHDASDGSALRVREGRVRFELIDQPGGVVPKLTLAGVDLLELATPRAGDDDGFLFFHDAPRGVLHFAERSAALSRLFEALESFRGLLPTESFPALVPSLLALDDVVQLELPSSMRGHERPAPKKLLLRFSPRFDEGVDVSLFFRGMPLSPLWPPGEGPELCYGLEDGVSVFTRRDLAAERALCQEVMAKLALEDATRVDRHVYRIERDEAALSLFSTAARLSDVVDLEWAEHVARPKVVGRVTTSDLVIQLVNKGHLLELRGGVHDIRGDVAIGRLLEAVRLGERYVRVVGRDHLEIERELFERLSRAQLCVNDSVSEPSLPLLAAPYWQAQLGAQSRAEDARTAALLSRMAQASTGPAADAQVAASILASAPHLRDYQRAGVLWLVAQSAWSPGVCLADEMGLGKTVQLAALLRHRGALGPALVVAPTSVVDNWRAELLRFAPELSCVLHRDVRKLDADTLRANTVLITSYERLVRDATRISSLRFATLVLDEAQLLRNARTDRARAVMKVEAQFRVALSGTPIENRLGDLWSVIHAVVPGFLGPWSRFRARFAVPIERYQDAERANALRTLVAPILLRRTKAEVALELPQRTEVIHRIELSPGERDLYQAAVRRARRALGKRRDDDEGRSVQILAELTKLRQLTCHPRLVIDDERTGSSKLTALLSLLSDILPRGHRVLVFSQFTRLLGLVREALQARGHSHLYLDGSIKAAERSGLVSRFMAGEAQVFLISLKAGGTGLNLTAADYVVHLDPWWNPAAEDQASDRAHRIGQARPVTIVKLLAEDTLEERVLELHERKRRLATSALGTGQGAFALDARTLEELLALA